MIIEQFFPTLIYGKDVNLDNDLLYYIAKQIYKGGTTQ